MRIALAGAAASALLGGTLALTPLTSVTTPLTGGGTCGGAKCERVASVLMPETPKPMASEPGPGQFSQAAYVTPPGGPAEPGAPSAASVTPGVASTPGFVGGGAPAAGVPSVGLGGLPDQGASGLPDANELLPGLAPAVNNAVGLAAVPYGVNAAYSIINGVVGVGGGVVGVASAAVGTVTSAAIALVYLQNLGILPKNLSLPGVGLPSLPGIGAPAFAAAALPAIPAVNLPGVPSLPGLPALPALPGGDPAALAAAALPLLASAPAGLPAPPALPAGLPALPAPPALPALPALPGPPPLPRLCTPSLGPIGFCTP